MITKAEMDEIKIQVREAFRLYREEYEKATEGDRLDAQIRRPSEDNKESKSGGIY